MSVLQSQHDEIRYLKRKGLEEESRIIGNALRDQIRQYGIDCTYYKLDESFSKTFKTVIDQNTILKRAYGYETNPDYSMSANMITYADVQQDIFMMNKLGYSANAEIDFNFDKIDFACALATKCGQLKEYKLDQTEVICQVPEVVSSFIQFDNGDGDSTNDRYYLSSHEFPFEIGIGSVQPTYTCGILSGKFRALIPQYEYGKEYTIMCDPYEHTDFNVEFPVNSDLYRSLKYKIENDDYLETLIHLTYRVDKILVERKSYIEIITINNIRDVLQLIQNDLNTQYPLNTIYDLALAACDISANYDNFSISQEAANMWNTTIGSMYSMQLNQMTIYELANMVEELYSRLKKSNLYASVLSGYVHGSILFYDIDKMGKYVELIRPSVGDIIEIDFPDDYNREKYEITDCFDKQLTQDGISPLMHKYIWKCKARRYVNSFEDTTPQSDADDKIQEIHKYNTVVDNEVAKEISMYDNVGKREVKEYDVNSGNIVKKEIDVNEDAAYGGYDLHMNEYDKQIPGPYHEKYDFIDDGTAIDLIRFDIGSRILTNGYDLLFETLSGDFYSLTTTALDIPTQQCMFEQDLKWLKATDSVLIFVNVEGEATQIACDGLASSNELQICLDSLYDKTLDDTKPRSLNDIRLDEHDDQPFNKNGQSFYKFKGTRTYLWSNGLHLYVKFASNGQLHRII